MVRPPRLPPAAVTERPEGIRFALRVTPRADRDEVGLEGGRLRVRLRAAPVEGAANAALLALLAERLGLPRSALQVLRGTTAREKLVEARGLSAEQFWQRLGVQAPGKIVEG